MKNKSFYSSLLDTFGTISLVGAAATLVGALWFGGKIPESTLFNAFHLCLGLGLGSFMLGRVVELTKVILDNPDPKRLRAVATAPGAVLAEHSNVTEGKFRKAA